MKLQVVVNSRREVIGAVPITPIATGDTVGIVGVAPMPDQAVYELDLPDAEAPTDPVALHRTCEQAIKSGVAQKVG